MCAHTKAEMNKLPLLQANRRGTPLLHKLSQAPFFLLAPGRTGSGIYYVCFSIARLLSPSLLPGLSPVRRSGMCASGTRGLSSGPGATRGLSHGLAAARTSKCICIWCKLGAARLPPVCPEHPHTKSSATESAGSRICPNIVLIQVQPGAREEGIL